MRDLLLGVHPFLTLLALVVMMASTIIAIGILRNTRQLLRLSDRRMEYLTYERDHLKLLNEERGLLEKTLEQERKERLAAQQRVGLSEDQTEPAKAANGKVNGGLSADFSVRSA
jgi:hypothetical protein